MSETSSSKKTAVHAVRLEISHEDLHAHDDDNTSFFCLGATLFKKLHAV